MFFGILCFVGLHVALLRAEYYCTHDEDQLVAGTCYKYSRVSRQHQAAAEDCQANKMKLPAAKSASGIVSGWLDSHQKVEGRYCVFVFPDPSGVVSADRFLYRIGACDKVLPTLCIDSKCGADTFNVDVAGNKYCVTPSSGTRGGSSVLTACPGGTVFPFLIQQDEQKKIVFDKPTDSALLQTFWAPLETSQDDPSIIQFLLEPKATYSITHTNSCAYRLIGKEAMLGDCGDFKTYYCQYPAGVVPVDDADAVVDPAANYTCKTKEDRVCQGRCYSYMQAYKTKVEAETHCTQSGYQLASHNILSCANNPHTWVGGDVTVSDSSVSLVVNDSSIALQDSCMYLFNGELYMGDCERRAHVLCAASPTSDKCPKDYTICDPGRIRCLGLSVEAVSWHDARRRNVCEGSGELVELPQIANQASLDDCKASLSGISDNRAVWLGARLGSSRALAFLEGDVVDPDKFRGTGGCLSVSSGILHTSDCDDKKYFTCEKLASQVDENPDPDPDPEPQDGRMSTPLIVVLVVIPILVLVVVALVLVYKKRGAAEEKEEGGGGVIMNTIDGDTEHGDNVYT